MIQEAALSDVGFKAKAAEVIGAYHPFWARLAMETIIGRAATGESAHGAITGASCWIQMLITHGFRSHL